MENGIRKLQAEVGEHEDAIKKIKEDIANNDKLIDDYEIDCYSYDK